MRLIFNQRVTVCSVLFAVSFAPPPEVTGAAVFEMTPLARELIVECGRQPDTAGQLSELSRTLFRTLQVLTWRLAQTPTAALMPVARSPGVAHALALIDFHLTEQLPFEDLALQVGQSPRTLARNLERELGLNWSQIIQRLRMVKAIELLAQTGAPITEVAFSVGYKSLSAFNAAFRTYTGRTPTAYRASFTGQPGLS
jgi:AraC-like DNA-binding protein